VRTISVSKSLHFPLCPPLSHVLYIISKSACADHRQTCPWPAEQRAKGNPMTDNARHVSGSTRSQRTRLSQSDTAARRFRTLAEKYDHYATKMRRIFKTQILICSTQTTYNFDPLKWSHFSELGHPLLADVEKLASEPCASRKLSTVTCCSFSLGEKVRMRDKLVFSFWRAPLGKPPFATVQNRTKQNDFTFFQKPTALYQRLTTTARHIVRFLAKSRRGELRRAQTITRAVVPIQNPKWKGFIRK
jgi:hypothetical protein